LTYGGATYGYTKAGELQFKVEGTDTTFYQYDALGNLLEVNLPDGTDIEYVVDGFNRRVGKKVDGVMVRGWLYQGQLNPVAELDSVGAVAVRFVYGTRQHVPDYVVKQDTTYRIVSDHLGSVRLVVRASDGLVVQQVQYDEFGREVANTNPLFQSLGYAGGLTDPQAGLVRFGIRDYLPTTGGWTTRDPLGFASGQPNLKAYVSGDPLNQVDPSGLEVFVGQHGALFRANPLNHLVIVLRPDNPADFVNHPLFLNSAGREATLSAHTGPGCRPDVFGCLAGTPNYPGDRPSRLEDLVRVCPPDGMTDTEFINALINAAGAYPNELPYAPFPGGRARATTIATVSYRAFCALLGWSPPRSQDCNLATTDQSRSDDEGDSTAQHVADAGWAARAYCRPTCLDLAGVPILPVWR
jgi:RHS repeat-associated protein